MDLNSAIFGIGLLTLLVVIVVSVVRSDRPRASRPGYRSGRGTDYAAGDTLNYDRGNPSDSGGWGDGGGGGGDGGGGGGGE